MTLNQFRQVLQVVCGCEDIHLHRFALEDPFAPLRPVDGELPEVVQVDFPAGVKNGGQARELDHLLTLGIGKALYEYDFNDS
ncbi:hypothetical protein J2808_004429 [Pseudarthrobacter sulfonivorans]|uniref:IS1096 element passenger TnpR family protein n=2 Tax=Micrococcaceae TaxID=1268 RepID=UPI002781A1B9|nr:MULTISPECIES: hypothetical protein [Micrococcaceae]MDQ0078628.1 hypothetical protein [Arthrobacter oryzae]MDR6417660.1 hypothetical protein [Pseudarthrobacter sulfonivorans]